MAGYEGRAVIIAGPHSAGKSTLGKALAETLQASMFEMGDVVREEAAKRLQSNLVVLAAEMMGENPLVIVEQTLERARGCPSPIIVGPRTAAELSALVKAYDHPLVVGLQADAGVRRTRWQRKSIGFGDLWEQRESYESVWHTQHLVDSATLKIDAQLPTRTQVRRIVDELGRVEHVG